MIPESRQLAVSRALEATFGDPGYEALSPLAGMDGVSTAIAYRLVVKGRPYLLRLVKETIPGIDPAREMAVMQRAADAGLAPRVWYADVADRVMIGDFVETRPYPPDAAIRLASTIRRLHETPAFAVSTHYVASIDRFVQRLPDAGLMPRSTADELLRLYGRASAVYPRDEAAWVPSHNDLKPPNTLYDGERFWLIDWEAAFMNDRYVDLAIAANFFVHSEAEEAAYLQAYFGAPADEVQRARFFLMSQIVSVAYVAVFGLMAAREGQSLAPDAPLPPFEDHHRRIARGEVDLGEASAKRLYAHIHLNRAIARMNTPRFTEALARVGDRA